MTMRHASDKRARISGVFTGRSFAQALRSPTRFALLYCKQRYAALKRMYLLSIKAPVLQANKNTIKDIKRARISGVFTGSSFVQALRSPTRFALVYCKQRYAELLNRMHLLSIKAPVLQANKNTNKDIKRARISSVFTGSSFVQALRSSTRFALLYCKQRYAALKRMYLLSIKAPVLQANKNANKDISFLQDQAITGLHCYPPLMNRLMTCQQARS